MRKLPTKSLLLCLFAFAMTATLSFLLTKHMPQAEASVAGFQAGNIMSDAVMSNYNSMTEAQIQTFLKSKNHCNDRRTYLAQRYSSYTYHIKDGHFVCMADELFGDGTVIGRGQTAARIIWQAAQDYKINPQVLIVLLQKEQGLITDTWPNSNHQYRSATGYGCPDTAACDSKYYGFKNQVRNAAALFRTVLNGGWSNYPAYKNNYIQYNPNTKCGGSNVYIQNRATSALYRYTPYQPNATALSTNYGTGNSCSAYGNRNFYSYFTDWFGKTTTLMDAKTMQVPEGEYYIASSLNTSKVADITSANTADGTNIQLYDRNNTNAQKWYIQRQTNGYYTLINQTTGKALDVAGASIKQGANIQLWSKNNTCAQQWKIVFKNGNYSFISTCSALVMDVDNAKTANGTNIKIWEWNNSKAQKFRLIPTGSLAEGVYSIRSSLNNGQAIDVAGAKTANGTNIQLYRSNSTIAQKWQITKLTDEYYSITNPISGQAIDVAGAKTANGTNIQLYQNNGTCAQKWIIIPVDSVNYSFISACSGKVIDVAGAKTVNGTNIQLYNSNNTAAQRWHVSRLPDGYFKIINPNSDKAFSLANIQAKAGTNIHLHQYNGACTKKWKIIKVDNRSHTIVSSCGPVVVDVDNARDVDGTNIKAWYWNASSAQKWIFSTPSNHD